MSKRAAMHSPSSPLKTLALLICLGLGLAAHAKDDKDDKKGGGKPKPTQPAQTTDAAAPTQGWTPKTHEQMLGMITLAKTAVGDRRPLVSCDFPVAVAQSAQDGTITFVCEYPQAERLTGKLLTYRVYNLYLNQGQAAIRPGSCANVAAIDACRRMGL